MVPYNTSPYPLPHLAFSSMAAAAGAQLSEIWAHEERPTRQPRPHECQGKTAAGRRRAKTMDATSSTNINASHQPLSFGPWQRHPISYIRPSNWKGPEHGETLLATWAELTDGKTSETPNDGEDFWDLRKKVGLAEDRMRSEFPALGQGDVRVGREWLEYVLGREGFKPFSSKEWREKLAQDLDGLR